MTREEAIDIIRQYECCKEHYEACEMAIQALSQEPQCTEQPCLGTLCRYYKESCRVKNELNVELNELKPCDDAVSRQAVLDIAKSSKSNWIDNSVLFKRVNELPPVTQKSGKWVDYSDEGYVECPFCGHATNCEDDIDELHYCFYCGAKMESEE